ncbi:MAG: flagellar filament outer layer protein FlaA [Spirochaetales bacterium]|nr:flagellar filament outer layer protein FlaA [Spirochaetales bacterium]
MNNRRIPLLVFMCVFLSLCAAAAVADEVATNIETKIIDDFDSSTTLNDKPRAWSWFVRGSKFIDPAVLDWKLVEGYPDTLYTRKQAEGKDLHILGIKGSFLRKGYNYYEVIPVTKDDKGNWIPRPIELPGIVKSIDLWVWGSGFNYNIEVCVVDSRGVNHNLQMGSILFEGWKSLSVNVPSYIPQSRRYIPKREALYLTKIVIWTSADERVNDFYVYFDQLKVNTDTFISKFDGDELADPEEINKLWTGGESFTK